MVLFSESGVLKPNLSKVQLVQIESGHWKGQTGKYCHYHCFGTKCIKCILNYRTIFDSIQSVQSVDDWFINDYLWARTMWGRKSCKRCHQLFCAIYFEHFTFRSLLLGLLSEHDGFGENASLSNALSRPLEANLGTWLSDKAESKQTISSACQNIEIAVVLQF